MAEPPPHPESDGATLVRPDRGSPPATPRWVKVFGIVVIILVVLFVVLHLSGGGFGGHAVR